MSPMPIRSHFVLTAAVIAAICAGPLVAPVALAGDSKPPSDSEATPQPLTRGPDTATQISIDPDDPVDTWIEQTVTQASPDPRALRRNPPAGRQDDAKRPISAGTKPIAGPARLFWPLFVVLAVIVVVMLAARKWLPRSGRLGGGPALNVLARHYLAPKQSLCLVRLGRRLLLIGVTPDRISTVAEIAEPNEASEILASLECTRPGSFTSVFARQTQKDLGKEQHEDPIEQPAPVAGRQLDATGASVRQLIDRVRSLSSGMEVSAEPT
jgi:flagellar biosynthetic protein FliO